LGRHYVKLTLPLRKAATLLRERELFYGLPTVGPTGMVCDFVLVSDQHDR
jgi:hypothetical protein